MRAFLLSIVMVFVWMTPAPAPFVPIGVWYGGGSVRAPMMPRDPAAHRDEWRRDLETIRGLGFNSVKTWVDWASTEPKPGEYRFEALDQLLALADETGLRVTCNSMPIRRPSGSARRIRTRRSSRNPAHACSRRP